MKQFHTRIDDRHFQEIHHALGCPWPRQIMGETYRNYFATSDDTECANRKRVSPHWSDGREVLGNLTFHVTDEGRKALYDHIMENIYVPARYRLTFHGHEGEQFVSAKNRSAAKYQAYVDCDIDWSFKEFVSLVKSVKIHTRAVNAHLAA